MLFTPLLPPVTNCHTFSDPFPSNVTYFMDGPLCVFLVPRLFQLFLTSAVAVFHHSPQNMAKKTISAYTSL